MVEYSTPLDAIFLALSDPTRRSMLDRVSNQTLTVGELASYYPLTFAAISKHLILLHQAGLITKTKSGRERYIRLAPTALMQAESFLSRYTD